MTTETHFWVWMELTWGSLRWNLVRLNLPLPKRGGGGDDVVGRVYHRFRLGTRRGTTWPLW